MATIPSVYNAALDAVVAQILADISGSVCERVSWLIEKPEDWWEPGSYPTTSSLVVAVIDGVVTEGGFDEVQVEEFDRGQRMVCPIRAWTVHGTKASLSETRVDDVRRIKNAIEAVGEANVLEAAGWTVDWEDDEPAGRLDNDSNRPPYAAIRAGLVVRAWE